MASSRDSTYYFWDLIFAAGIDFGSAPVTATFASNAVPGAEACGTISILPDIFIEGIESFQVVGSSTDASFPPTPANADTIFVNIEDDDCKCMCACVCVRHSSYPYP